jgi:hypothetical protein
MKISAVGVTWYRRDDYSQLLAIFEDAKELPATYDQWLASAEHARKDFEGAGAFVVRAIIDPDTFPEWCLANGHKINAKARIEFATQALLRQWGGRN